MIDSLKRWFVGYKKEETDDTDHVQILRQGPMPKHVAVIMDGNGRWAKKRGLPRIAGHHAGMNTVRQTIRAADELGIEVLTLYSFSTENWKRPREEVEFLMKLPAEFLKTDLQELIDRNVRVQMLGALEALPEYTYHAISRFQEETKENTGMILNFALNYGARAEIITAIKQMTTDIKAGELDEDAIDESVVNRYLYTSGLPDPDLMIRTSGEIRISNFMLWQLAYSELYFTDVAWPDFDREHFFRAIEDFQRRSRRYGAV